MKRLIPLVMVMAGCGSGNSGGTDLVDAAVPLDAPDLPEMSDPGTPDVPPPPPLYEKGLIAPRDFLPCFHHDTGKEAGDCNHHGSSVAVKGDGTVLAVWYHGVGEKSKDSAILWSRRPKGDAWTEPEVLFDDPGHAEGNPVIWVREDGCLYLFFVTILGGNSWNDGVIRLITSDDGGTTWSDVTTLREEWHWMVRNHPLRMSNGELLLPCYDEALYIPGFMWSDNDFETDWVEPPLDSDFLINHLSAIQPTVIERSDGTLYALNRQTSDAWAPLAWEMTSDDFGRTWSPRAPSAVPNEGNSMEMTTLASGRVMVVFNNATQGRFPLAAALSEDEALTWTAVGHLNAECEGTHCSYGYPSLAQDLTDDSVWVTYTHDRDTIGWVHVNESWLLEQKEVFATQETP